VSQPLGTEIDPNEFIVPGNNPPDNPNDRPTAAMMVASNTGIGIFGAAGIFFCLHDLLQAFLVALLIVIALAIGNIVLLLIVLRPYCYPAGARAAAKTAGTRTGSLPPEEARRKTLL
jgi:hypothetical protein